MACPHHWTGLFRFPMRDGRWQIREMCLDCHRNVRPQQPNVPFSEAGDWIKLPIWDEVAGKETNGMLF